MKKYILPFASILCLLASCSRYQASTISSTNITKDERTGTFNMENDSVKISYSFYGINAPVEIQVYNKLDKPLYIDWQKSAVIVGDNAVSYAGKDVHINGDISTSGYRFGSVSSTSGNLNAVATLPTDVTFLPPHSRISNVPLTVVSGLLNVPDSALAVTQVYYVDADNGSSMAVRAKQAKFTAETSPLKFKSYLTLYTTEGESKKVQTYQQNFFVSQLISTMTNPKNWETYRDKRGDVFITAKNMSTASTISSASGSSSDDDN
ncbi:hypothetical protein [Mucilaginibacter lacusdianchii]|uniref:hypothetical protein n=1 Tax=Mucilaginibacter lacusdianchii TaxID=2684211 RepID=UPI00131DA6D4|nr:hypothetical protein [Mucilaginibacter sp. JXJ CY 39]